MTMRCDGHEIPAYAGMTVMGVGSRFRGNDVAHGGVGAYPRKARIRCAGALEVEGASIPSSSFRRRPESSRRASANPPLPIETFA